jgi:hypothetical protein
MSKLKGFIYPFVFSIGFFVSYLILLIVINTLDFSEGYGGLGLFFLFVILWVLVAIPIYCFRYCKIIFREKLIFLFVLYNSIVVAFSHTGYFLISAIPNDDADIIIKITIALFGWIALCTYISYLIRLNTTDEQDDNNSHETQE